MLSIKQRNPRHEASGAAYPSAYCTDATVSPWRKRTYSFPQVVLNYTSQGSSKNYLRVASRLSSSTAEGLRQREMMAEKFCKNEVSAVTCSCLYWKYSKLPAPVLLKLPTNGIPAGPLDTAVRTAQCTFPGGADHIDIHVNSAKGFH